MLSTTTFQLLSIFPQDPSFFFISVPLWIFLLSKSHSLSPQSLYFWAYILTKATRTMNDVLCLHVAGHLTWPSTISGELSEHVIHLMTEQQGSLAEHKMQTKQHRVIKHKPAGGRIHHAHQGIKRILLACLVCSYLVFVHSHVERISLVIIFSYCQHFQWKYQLKQMLQTH